MTAICSVCIDSMAFGRYSSSVAAKSAAGIGVLKVKTAHNRAQSGFFVRDALSHLSMVGWAGEPKGSPGSVLTGYANPVQFTTSQIGVCGGEFSKLKTEAAIMATTPTEVAPAITVVNGYPVTTSLAVADYFNKLHKDVLAKITRLECSAEFTERNFTLSEYTDVSGRKLPCYLITRDGFAFLAMGFTGKRAAQFKEAYITAFSAMESALNGKYLRGELSRANYNLNAVYDNLSAINRAWDESLRPMLAASKSPLASSLNDRIKDALLGTCLVKKDLGGAK
ncbi:peptidase [Plesiomonas shigelloides]|nr:peptidase [Plesiomonas shigelloides]